jgi:hypothetical protein
LSGGPALSLEAAGSTPQRDLAPVGQRELKAQLAEVRKPWWQRLLGR